MKRLLAALATIILVVAAPALAAPRFPPLTGRVVDNANVLSARAEAELTERLAGLETRTGHQVVVATLRDLQGYEIEEYGYQLGRAWKIGDEARDDGVLLIVAPSEKKVRIEVGYGLEPVLTDTLSAVIIQSRILPKFRDGDLPGGIEAGVDAIASQLELPDDQAQAVAAQVEQRPVRHGDGGFGAILGFVFFFFFVLPILGAILSGGRGRRRGQSALGSAVPWIVLGALSQASRHRGGWGGGGWGGGGWSGGGGFSGGGGSFGGGGASGGW